MKHFCTTIGFEPQRRNPSKKRITKYAKQYKIRNKKLK